MGVCVRASCMSCCCYLHKKQTQRLGWMEGWEQAYEPVIEWAQRRWGVPFVASDSIFGSPQSEEAAAAVRSWLDSAGSSTFPSHLSRFQSWSVSAKWPRVCCEFITFEAGDPRGHCTSSTALSLRSSIKRRCGDGEMGRVRACGAAEMGQIESE